MTLDLQVSSGRNFTGWVVSLPAFQYHISTGFLPTRRLRRTLKRFLYSHQAFCWAVGTICKATMKMTSSHGQRVLLTVNLFGTQSQNWAFSNCQHLELSLAAKYHDVFLLLHVSHFSNNAISAIKPELALFVMTHRDDENMIALPDLDWFKMALNVSQRCLLIPHPLFKN